MKKTTFIVALAEAALFVVVLLLVWSNASKQIWAMQQEIGSLQEQLGTLQSCQTSLATEEVPETDDADSVEEVAETVEEVPETKENLESVEEVESIVYISSTALEIPQIPLESEDIKASIIFCGNSFEVSTSTEENREHINVLTLPYYGGDVVRTCDLVASGATVNAIYRMDNGNWTPIQDLKYDGVDNTYLASMSIEGTDTNVFMIQTVNGSHSYFGIRSQY